MDRDGDAGAQTLKKALMSDGYRDFRLDSWIWDNIDSILHCHEFDGVKWATLPYRLESPKLTELEDLVGMEIYNELPINLDKVEFFCDLAVVGIFQCSIPYSDWKEIIHPRQVVWSDEQSDGVWTYVGIRSVGSFLMRITFDLNSATVIAHDVTAIEHNFNISVLMLKSVTEL